MEVEPDDAESNVGDEFKLSDPPLPLVRPTYLIPVGGVTVEETKSKVNAC